MKIKCIDNADAEAYLTVGKVYDATDSDMEPLTHYAIGGFAWLKHRFVVDEYVSSNAITNKPPAPATLAKVDAEEEAAWKAMRPYVEPGYCICGCHKSRCTYHKDT